MIIYEGMKTDFIKSVENSQIVKEIKDFVYQKMSRRTPMSELRAWENSLQYMHMVLSSRDIPDDVGVAIEYNIPQTAKRVDFMVFGYDQNNQPGVVIIELKQWNRINLVNQSDSLVTTFLGYGERTVVHPSYQVYSYAQLISDYNEIVDQQEVRLAPCAFLHNYQRVNNDPIDAQQYKIYTDKAPVFTRGQIDPLRGFIKKWIKKGDKKKLLYQLEKGKIRPSKSLQDVVASVMKGNQEFLMIDEQRVAFEKIMQLSQQCVKDNKKRTIICKGGPGTGKSVIAIHLLAALTQKGQLARYVSKNSEPRKVYSEKMVGSGNFKKVSIKNMFASSGEFVDVPNEVHDVLIVDEAHRLNAKSGMYKNKGENQIKEIIQASKCSVFFIDDNQRVTINDIGSVDAIIHWAKKCQSDVTQLELVSQFRCNGSNGYLAWVDDVLGIRQTANYDLDGIDYDVRICDTPHEMFDYVLRRNDPSKKITARVLAGYCWNWPKLSQNNPDYADIKIDDFEMSWNLSGSIFALDDNAIKQAGCIHTSQGLEFDYVGVIIGNDMRFENDSIVTDFNQRAKTDQSMKGIKKLFHENKELAQQKADAIIKNTYRTLLTRAMKGCYIFCTDKNLRDYLKKRLVLNKN